MGQNTFLEAEALSFSYRKQADRWVLKDIDLSLRPDEYVLVCGASGSGKSTLGRTFNGLIPHFYDGTLKGEVRVSGKSIREQSVGDLFDRVGMVFQNSETQLFNHTVDREISFGLESLGLSRSEIDYRIAESTDTVGIRNLLDKNPHRLSGGEQQLVAIASILALRPRLLILDEPYANLDSVNVRRVRAALHAIHQQGTGIVVCEHRLRYTVSDASRMVVLNKGRKDRDGDPATILSDNLESCGLEGPLFVRASRRIGLSPVALSMETLLSESIPVSRFSDLKPRFPENTAPGAETVLEVENLSFSLNGRSILKNISFSLREGESLAIVGANGAGKTVLLKQLNGLYRPARGKVRIMGNDIRNKKVSQLAASVGIAFQNPNSQFFKLTVWDEITTGARILGTYDETWIKELVELFQLGPLLSRAPFRLSGGEKKRVAFAAALAQKPRILALDEPTAGQDWHFRQALGDLLKSLRCKGQAIILVTHDLLFAEQHAHRWLLMAGGEIAGEGSPWNVMADRKAMEKAHLEATDAFRLFNTPRK